MSSPDFTWLIDHGPDIYARYRGLWIAVHDGKVIGVGQTATEAAEQARKDDPEAEFILEAVDSESDVIYAHLQVVMQSRRR